MFTEEDYVEYFGQIGRVERKMIYGAYELANRLNVSKISAALKHIGDDEVRHYGYVLKLFELISAPQSLERRRGQRENCLGSVFLRGPGGEEISANIFNLSATGACLECDRELSFDHAWDLKISIFDKGGEKSCRGNVIWCKEVRPGLYVAGISFLPGTV